MPIFEDELPYITVHKNPQMSKDTIKKLMVRAKLVMLTWTKNKYTRPIYGIKVSIGIL